MKRTYPSRSETERTWAELAASIVEDSPNLSDTAAMEPATALGELTIIGSGIGVMGFTRDAEQYIDAADQVLFCVADPVTQVWLRERRPDSIDLYALYDDRKRRYETYVQMTEAMLFHVRRGKRVVAVFYGHPGIFVLSTHRAIAIARREGHRAQMRPGISALDWLCADLGVDPAFPGMQTFEATDMLLRRRAIDICAHVVLWQVGLIAEMGFRRRGFLNRNFAQLVDYLSGYYPTSHVVTHYIASRYPGLAPTIERYRIEELLEPDVQRRLTGISTLYIPPAEARPVDVDFAREVGLIGPRQAVGAPRVQRDIGRYGPREMRAIRRLKDFRLPPDYHFQADNAPSKFILELAERPELRRLYESDPEAAMKGFRGLNARERALLASRRTARVQLAARGARVQVAPAEQFVIDLATSPSLQKAWLQVLRAANDATPKNWSSVDVWLGQNYPGVTLDDVPDAFSSVEAWQLLMWNGVYAESGTKPNVLMVMAGTADFSNGSVYLNAAPLYKVAFANTQLTFKQSDGNPCNGELTFAHGDTTGSATANGMIWTDSQGKPVANNFSATLQPLPDNPLSVWTGEYATTYVASGKAGPNVAVYLPDTTNPSPAVYVDGQPVSGTFASSVFTWGSDNKITFAIGASAGALTFSGTIAGLAVNGAAIGNSPASFQGQYATQQLVSVHGSPLWQPFYPLAFIKTGSGVSLTLAGRTFAVTYADRKASWASGGPTNMEQGELYFAVNPLNSCAYFRGVTWAAGKPKPDGPNLEGVASANALVNFTGTYPTTLDGKPAANLVIAGGPAAADVKVTYGGTAVKAAYSAGRITGVAGADQLAATFKYVVDTSKPPVTTRAFDGTITTAGASRKWASTTASNDMVQWVGTYDTSTVNPDNNTPVPGGPAVTIAATDATSFTVTLTIGGTATTIAGARYQSQGNTLFWANQNIPNAGDYNNAAISFYTDGRAGTKQFKGIFYQSGPAPKSVTWIGTLRQSGGDGGGGPPSWVWWLVGSLATAGTAFAAWRFYAWWSAREGAGYVQAATNDGVEMEKLKCE